MACSRCSGYLRIIETWKRMFERIHEAALSKLEKRCEGCAQQYRAVLGSQYIMSQDLFSGKVLPPGVTMIDQDFIDKALEAIEFQQKYESVEAGDDGKGELLRELRMRDQKILALERQLQTWGATA